MILRNATRDDLDIALDRAATEGWNPGLEDAAAFWAADPQGFFVAMVANRPVAFVSVVNHSADQAFLGLYLCGPAWRGKGIVMAVWIHAMSHAGARSIGLDGVAAQQANYAKSGFVRVGGTQRWEGHVSAVPHPGIRQAGIRRAGIRRAGPEDLTLLQALDTAANGYRREAFLKTWINATLTRQTGIFADGSGFATARRCRTGIKIGPLIAPDADASLQLVHAASGHTKAAKITLDLPETNTNLAGRLADLGFTMGFTTARMVRGDPPRPTAQLQAIGTMELG